MALPQLFHSDGNQNKAMHRVFVYGSLKQGLENHRLLENAVFIGEAYTIHAYRMLDGRFPVLRDSGADRYPVSGEVFEVDEPTLMNLDDLEDIASGVYDRVPVEIISPDGTLSKAFVYIGCAAYWDARSGKSFMTLNAQGHLEWMPSVVAKPAENE